MLLAVYFYSVYRNRVNAVILNELYLSNSFIHIKENRDYRKTLKIPHKHVNNINSIVPHVRNKILQPSIFFLWFKKYYV